MNSNNKMDLDYIPYIAMINLYNQEEVEKYFSIKYSPFMKWPDLPDEIQSESYRSSIAKYLRDTHLFLPIHQSINIHSVSRMSELFIK